MGFNLVLLVLLSSTNYVVLLKPIVTAICVIADQSIIFGWRQHWPLKSRKRNIRSEIPSANEMYCWPNGSSVGILFYA